MHWRIHHLPCTILLYIGFFLLLRIPPFSLSRNWNFNFADGNFQLHGQCISNFAQGIISNFCALLFSHLCPVIFIFASHYFNICISVFSYLRPISFIFVAHYFHVCPVIFIIICINYYLYRIYLKKKLLAITYITISYKFIWLIAAPVMWV